ncbi:hypothetical protein Gotri_022603 [Gossypium trilobum]|uniref:DUF4283 domain-containing protein n=1 Tax=Gossypium trilobum TaxID=34281 RepID=A0A7J9DGB8_9ROSI|nr:hypothetical protein [Gossypium trilobum]
MGESSLLAASLNRHGSPPLIVVNKGIEKVKSKEVRSILPVNKEVLDRRQQSLSFRCKLLENIVEDNEMVLGLNDIFELRENDVMVSRGGLVSKIVFSERVHEMIDKSMASTIIVQLLGKSINFKALQGELQNLWQPIGEFKLIDLYNEYFLVKFTLAKDYN